MEPRTGIEPAFSDLRNRCAPLSAIAASAVGAGIEPAEGALTVRPVYQHTSPTRWKRHLGSEAASAGHGRPPRTIWHAVTPFRIVREQKAHVRLRCARR